MRVGILSVQVPFVRGGAEEHARSLCEAIRASGAEAEIITIPFKWYPPAVFADQILASQLIDVEESCGKRIDRVIGLKFPAYLIPHPNKVLWILHQHRSAYDLWEKPYGDLHHYADGHHAARLIMDADRTLIPNARRIYANSRNVADRLRRYCDIESKPLYHPPPYADRYDCNEVEDFFLVPGRINSLKRQDLVLQALKLTRSPIRVVFIGSADEACYADTVRRTIGRLAPGRADWLGEVSLADKLRLFGSCLGIIVPTLDEDYGYVTLEAMLSSKPVITCSDSGGPLEFVVNGETGTICEPDAASLARAMDELWADRNHARQLGRAGRAGYEKMNLSWAQVVDTLLS